MHRRHLAAIAAALLAVLGAVVILNYVSGADARAQAGEDLVPVLVVTGDVAAGTKADALGDRVAVEQVPARLAAPGSTDDLADLSGKVTDAALLPGEQVLTGRFVDPAVFRPAGSVAVPAGQVEVSVSLEAQRAVGGTVKAGDLVGVQLTAQQSAATGLTGLRVSDVLHSVLVTRVAAPAAGDPAGAYLVTLAVSPKDASTVILGATAGALWLSMEQTGATTATATTTATTATLGDDK